VPVSKNTFDTSLLSRLSPVKLWLVALFVSIILAELTVATVEFILKGEVTYDYLLTALINTLLVSAPIAAILIYILHQHSKARELILRNQYQINESQRIAQVGSWEYNLASRVLHCSPEMFKILGLEASQSGIPYNDIADLIHPDDREKIDSTFNEALNNRVSYEIAYRLCMPDSSTKYLIERGETFCDSNHTPVSIIGTYGI
jgi:PAS domain-containing protein